MSVGVCFFHGCSTPVFSNNDGSIKKKLSAESARQQVMIENREKSAQRRTEANKI